MSVARHHAEWLSLVEASGPFLSLSVLMQAFPQGLHPHDPDHLRNLRLSYEEWQIDQESRRPDPAIHRYLIEYVLRETLGFNDEVLLAGQKIPESVKAAFPEHGETLRPDLILVNPPGAQSAGSPRMLVQIMPPAQDLDKRIAERRWTASPATRMMELLHSCDIRLGLVTNGYRWMLVNAPRSETTGFISWYANLWLEEHITLRAFRSLLGAHRFFAVEDSQTLDSLLKKSIDDQTEVTNQLGYQVRKAVEVLVQKLDRIDKDRDHALLKGMKETHLYEAALTLMMRLVFLFSAEEQGLLLLGDELYDNYYAVSTLRAQLREQADQHGEQVLERRSDAWARLLGVFRAVHGGARHDYFQLPAYGGKLFDPDRFPFLEGREAGTRWKETPARPLPVDNRTVLHLLEALQILQIKVPGGGSEPRRLSFRALDVEQIGHVYEGLLDHTAIRANSPVLGLAGTKSQEPEVPIEELERMREKGEDALLQFLKEQTGRSPSALKNGLSAEISQQEAQMFLVVCDNDNGLWERVRPFAGFVRRDAVDYPVIITKGSVYVTQGSDRRTTGTHYTPRSLTEPIVQYTLEPIVYYGPAEGKPKEEWRLKSAGELLQIKVCDIAMGSGAFLVQACRYLAERLVEAWEEAELKHPGQIVITPEGRLSEGRLEESLIPKEADERLIVARRIAADRCIYGVDINPMAAEMAKLSLWLVTMQKNKPFTFLDHALRSGDSLLGVTSIEQIEYFHLNPQRGTHWPFGIEQLRFYLKEILDLRREIESIASDDIEQIKRKESLLRQAESRLYQLRLIADVLVGEFLKNGGKIEPESAAALELSLMSGEIVKAFSGSGEEFNALEEKRNELLKGRRPFHWLLEFPEVFWSDEAANGFDAIVGNPPFQGGTFIAGTLGSGYREYLVRQIANGRRGNADLCAYFFIRSIRLLGEEGGLGMLATNSIAQGDTRQVGLDLLDECGCKIFRAISSRQWPGTASLEVSHLWIRKGGWLGKYTLDEYEVHGITTLLTMPRQTAGKPYRLFSNIDKSFTGNKIYGDGFTLTPEEAQQLIIKDSRNQEILFPYLGGQDLNSSPSQTPDRWVINFGVRSIEEAEHYSGCFEIVKCLVKPYRETVNEPQTREKWWLHQRNRPALYAAISQMQKVLVRARIADIHSMVYVPNGWVYNDKIVVFPNCSFTVLQSNIHEVWAREYSSSLRTDMQYTPSDCFETFPFPSTIKSDLDSIGEQYHAYRQSIMLARQEGLTKTYNRFHNPSETSSDIQKLRELHVEMDNAVAAAYGWTDLNLGHGFHETKQGTRYTICEPARREVLDRLLLLNHERYEEEVKEGLHDKGKSKKKSASGRGKKAKVETDSEQEKLF